MFIKLSKTQGIEVHAGDQSFRIYEGDEGGLYLEGRDRSEIAVHVSDEDDDVEISGQWVNVSLVPPPV